MRSPRWRYLLPQPKGLLEPRWKSSQNRGERPKSLGNGKIALVLLYNCNQELGGKFEIFILELADERLRVFDKLCDFVD